MRAADSYFSCSVWVGSSLQKQHCYIHLPVFGCYMKGSEAFLHCTNQTALRFQERVSIIVVQYAGDLGFGQHCTLVILVSWAFMSSRMLAVCACPSREAMCSGVCPAVVVELGFALCSNSSFTISLWHMRAAQCNGVWSS